jgi:hypothetical protein
MTATFSFSRLFKLIRKQWFENSRLYFFSMLALLALLGLVFLFWISTSSRVYREEGTYIIFIFGAYIAGSVFASMSFNMLGDKAKGSYWLGFPASHLEKLLSIIFYNVIFFTVVYCACFFLIKSVALTYVHYMVAAKPGDYSYDPMEWDHGFGEVFTIFIYVFFALQAFYLLGSVYFSRFSFVITTVVGAAMLFAFALYSIYLSKNYLPDDYNWNGSYAVQNHIYLSNNEPSINKRVELSPFTKDLLSYSVKFIWAPLFWVVAWFRLKEKEI